VSENATAHVRRRLAAILFVGYERLEPRDAADSDAGPGRLQAEIMELQVREFRGHIIRWDPDGVLIEFESVVEAARCADRLLHAVAQLNQALSPDRQMALRIGLNLDDVILEGDDVFGDGVNVAARLKSLAEPGCVYVSEIVRDRVTGRVDFDFADLGLMQLKNIARPVRVYRMGSKIVEQSAAAKGPGGVSASGAGFDNNNAVAVLPFVNLSNDPEQEFLADGITESIISMLAGWRAFPVVARNSTFTYKGQSVDIKKIGEELDVRYVVEGSVRKSGQRLRVSAQLIQTQTGHHVMAERFDRDLTGLFELQDEITCGIVGAIEPELLRYERERIAERPQHSEDAYELYQRGMFHHYRQNKTDNAEAQAYFRRALAIEPRYPQAAGALSIALTIAAYLSWADDPERNYQDALELAQRAVALDPRYPNAHFALALISMWTGRNDRATAEFQEAIRLNPSFAAAHAVLGAALNFGGQSEAAIASIEKGIRLSPNDPRLFIWLSGLAAAHYQLRHYSEAVAIGRRSWALNRNYITGLAYVVAGLAQLGQIEQARSALADLKEFDPKLAAVRTTMQRLYQNQAAIDHLLDGLRKAGFE
jgi:adenylate cyclase